MSATPEGRARRDSPEIRESDDERATRLDEELRLATARFAGIVEISADAIISVDADRAITLFNEGAEAIFGWTAAEVIGAPLEILLPERFRAQHPRYVQDFGGSSDHARRMGHRRQISGLRKDGQEFPAEASISRHDVGGRRVYNVVLRDVTERQRAEDEQRFLAGVGEVLGASLDYDLTVRGAARLAVPVLGDACTVDVIQGGALLPYTAAHVHPDRERLLVEIHRRWQPDLAGAHALGRAVRERRSIAVPSDEELGALAQGGEHLALLRQLGFDAFLYVPMLAGGEVIGVLRLARAGRPYGGDELALAEELVRRLSLALDSVRLYERAQHAIRARDETISLVSHDLRNPVNAIKMIATSLLAAPASPALLEDYLRTIAEAARQCDGLIQDLLDVSRIEAGRLRVEARPADLSALMRGALHVLAPLAADRGLSLEATVPDGLPRVLADEQRLQQVLSNLVGNAIKFTPSGGRVTVEVDALAPESREVVVTVRDTGPGIAAGDLPHLFDRYWQGERAARRAGAGLGLPIAKGIVEAHGGRLWAESEPERGSVFRFTLRVA